MSKELTPLEALNDLIDYLEAEHYTLSENEDVVRRKQIIETALKDYEKKTKLAKEYADVNNVAKRLKALEIIKEKKLSMDLFDGCQSAEQYNKYMFDMPYFQLTQKEYELLKEVLL